MADDSAPAEPTLRNAHHQRTDQLGQKFIQETEKLEKKVQGNKSQKEKDQEKPAGGFDATEVPRAPPGHTLKITFHRATNLPFADLNSLSSDPYIIATLKTNLEKRHKQDPDLKLRTPTIHKNTNPEWNAEWIVANVPTSGFFLKCRLYDEDPADHDDRLGNAHIYVDGISDNWTGFKEKGYDIKKRMGSKRAYLIRGCATLFDRNLHMGGELIISIENLGKTPGDSGGKAYTVGPQYWSRHFSPLIGRLTGIKDADDETDVDGKKKKDKYNFQAIQIQLAGPVPDQLYHRYVEFRPFVAGMFTSHSLRGRILNRALHHQHARIYNYDRATLYGVFQEPCIDMTKQFLEFVHHDQGGRIFTYVITLDGQWRFTETGKEFGVDLLSKHTMHSDVSIYISFSGEFFIRKLKNPPPPPHEHNDDKPDSYDIEPPSAEPSDKEKAESDTKKPDRDPHHYELIIDNDSGTYRPNAKYLPTLREFMEKNLPGLKVTILDCQADEEKMTKMKDEQREKKKNSRKVANQKPHSSGGISSSDEKKLDQRAQGGGKDGLGAAAMTKKEIKGTKEDMKEKKEGAKHFKENLANGQVSRNEEHGGIEGEDAPIRDQEGNQKSFTEKQEPLQSQNERANNGMARKEEPVNPSEKTVAEVDEDVQQPNGSSSYYSQATTA